MSTKYWLFGFVLLLVTAACSPVSASEVDSTAPQGMAADLIQKANESTAPILSLDIPSGLDATNGQVFEPHIRAAATITLALPKIGLLADTARSSVGELYLADISIPPQLYSKLGLEVDPIFAKRDIIQI